jgi:EmrB/QacA subfamily drug resistance transporter
MQSATSSYAAWRKQQQEKEFMAGKINPRTMLCVVYVIAMVMDGLDATIVNPALVAMSRTFDISPAATNMVEIGFLISFAAVIPVAGWLGDRWGSKRVFLSSLAVFTLASALCGAAPSISALVVFRVLQGVAGGLLAPVGMAMMYRAFTPEERLNVARYVAIPTTIAPAIGPIIGGWITHYVSWRWIFYINIPFAIIALVLGILFIQEHREESVAPFDWRGFSLAVPGIGMLLYALGDGPLLGWAEPLILICGIGGLALVIAYIVLALRTKEPMLDVRIFGNREFRVGASIACAVAAGLFGLLYIFPLMYQAAIGANALDAGFTIFPEAIGLLLASQVVRWSFHKFGPRFVILGGLLVSMLVFFGISSIDAETNRWLVRGLLLCVGFFLGHAVLALQVISFDSIDGPDMGQAMSLFNVTRQLGGGLGVAIASAILIQRSAGDSTHLASYQAALLGCAAFLLIGLLCALQIRARQVEPELQAAHS